MFKNILYNIFNILSLTFIRKQINNILISFLLNTITKYL